MLNRMGDEKLPVSVSLVDLARQVQRMRAIVAKLFPRDMFRDSAWDMLLELFIAGQQGRGICVKDLVIVSHETSTSALRRIDRLEETGLLRRGRDNADYRRVAIALTPKGEDAMATMLHSLILDLA